MGGNEIIKVGDRSFTKKELDKMFPEDSWVYGNVIEMKVQYGELKLIVSEDGVFVDDKKDN